MLQQCLIDIRRYTTLCISTIVAVICSIVGTDTMAFKFLLQLMVVDYITGLMVAGWFRKSPKTKNGSLSSSVAIQGIKNKCLMLLYVAIAIHLQGLIQVDYTTDVVVGWFIGNEGISILENGGLMGVPYPKKLRCALEVLCKEDNNEN